MNKRSMKACRIMMTCLCLVVLMSGCGGQKEETPDPGFVQMGNPLVTVASAEEMETQLGYTVPVLDRDVSDYIVLVIDGAAESGRIRYADGSDFNIKQGSGDISGIYGGTQEEEMEIDSVAVTFFRFENIRYAIWEKDGFAFSLSGGETLVEDVAALIHK